MKTILVFLLMIFSSHAAYAAVGCDLNDPDRDVKRLFPGSTGYKTQYVSIDKKGGTALLARIEQRLGDKFQGLFETIDVPYTVYEVYRGTQRIGYIHGVNQKGKFGGIQVFLSLDLNGVIRAFYFQKLTSREAAKLRAKQFGDQFIGLSLKEFASYDVAAGTGAGRIAAIANPAPGADTDFRASLRAVKKNLILMDEFVFSAR